MLAGAARATARDRDVDGAGSQEWEAAEGARVLRGALAALTRDGTFPLDGLTPRSPASAAEGAVRAAAARKRSKPLRGSKRMTQGLTGRPVSRAQP